MTDICSRFLLYQGNHKTRDSMFRIFLTFLAYIISFLSHSNGMEDLSNKDIDRVTGKDIDTVAVSRIIVVEERKKNVNLEFTSIRSTE